MDLLQAGVDRAAIALWLGHESVETTQIYLEATLAMKEAPLAKTSHMSVNHPDPARRQFAGVLEQPVDRADYVGWPGVSAENFLIPQPSQSELLDIVGRGR